MEQRKKRDKIKLPEKEFYGIVLLLACLFIILLFISSLYPVLLWDENVYLGNARSHLGSSNFIEDFRFPLLEYIIATIWAFTGESIFIARFTIILFTLASILTLYHISRRYFSWKISLILCLLFSSTSLLLAWGFRVYADIPAMFFTLLSFYFLLKDYEKNNPKEVKWIALASISSALAFLARFSSALFPLAVLIYFSIKKKPKKIVLFLLFMFIALLPWLIFNVVKYGNPVWDLIEQEKAVAEYTYFEPIIKQILNLFSFTNVLIPILMLVGFYPLAKEKKLNLLILIFIILSFIFYLFLVKLKDARYYLSFLPFIYIAAFQGFVFLIGMIKLKRIRIIRLIAIILIFSLLAVQCVHLFNFYKLTENIANCEKKSSTMLAIDYLKYKVGKGDIILGNNWPWYGYHLNVKTYSLYDPRIDILIFQHNPKYVIYNPTMGIPYDKKTLDNSKFLVLEKEIQGNCEKTFVYKVIK